MGNAWAATCMMISRISRVGDVQKTVIIHVGHMITMHINNTRSVPLHYYSCFALVTIRGNELMIFPQYHHSTMAISILQYNSIPSIPN